MKFQSKTAFVCSTCAACRAAKAVGGGELSCGNWRGGAQEAAERAGQHHSKRATEGGGEGTSGEAEGATEGGTGGHDYRPAEREAELHVSRKEAEEIRPGEGNRSARSHRLRSFQHLLYGF